MRQQLIDDYKINFQNRIDKNRKVDKFPLTNNGILSFFLYGWNVRHINENLLPDIDNALLNPQSENENGNGIVNILIYQDKVVFYQDEEDPFTMSTIDFKEVVIAWRDFLLKKPADGSTV